MNNKGTAQSAQMCRLICAFFVHKLTKTDFLMFRPKLYLKGKWAGTHFKVQVHMFVQRTFQSVRTSAQSDQSPSFRPEETLSPWLPIECTSKLWSDCEDARADWSEASIGAHANLYLLLDTGSYVGVAGGIRSIINCTKVKDKIWISII